MDLDGVLVDFEAGVREACGRDASEMKPSAMWPVLARTPRFYDRLGWMNDGRELWESVVHLNPVILTGLPMGQWAEVQKRSWCARELGEDVPVITGMSRHKADLAQAWLEEEENDHLTPVLVDDRLKLRESWEDMGGVFILHVSAEDSLNRLKEKGVL